MVGFGGDGYYCLVWLDRGTRLTKNSWFYGNMIQPYEISIELSKHGHNCHFNEDIFDLHHSSIRARFESAMLTNNDGPQNENRMTQPKGSGYKKADGTEELKSIIFFLWDF